MTDDSPLEWRVTRQSPGADYRIFKTRFHDSVHPESGQKGTFSIVDSPDWVNVVAITPDEHVVMVRQFRHGTGTVTLEIPGGLVDPGEGFIEAGRRELLEETGYSSPSFSLMGTTHPNPAFMTNRCGVVLVRDVAITRGQSLDTNEFIQVVLVPLKEIPDLIASGVITHTLVISAFFLLKYHHDQPA